VIDSSEPIEDAADVDPIEESPPERRRLGVWQKVLVAGSIALMVLGLGLQIYAWTTADGAADAPAPAEGGGTAPALVAGGFAPIEVEGDETRPPDGEATERDGLDAWSPVVFRMGFSFFVGFCIAYALRTFVKVSIIAIGMMLLVLFGLQYAGIVEVNWLVMEDRYDTLVAWLQSETSSFTGFVTGYLPSAALATFGLVVGFRKRG